MNIRMTAMIAVGMGLAAGAGVLCANGPQTRGGASAMMAPHMPGTQGDVSEQGGAIPPAQRPLRVTTQLVQIGVLVQDTHGNPVTGLTRDDFVVLDNKEPQDIQLFSVDASFVLPGPNRPLPRNTFSNDIDQGGAPSNLTVILMDSFNTQFLDQAYAHSQLVKFLGTLQPHDRVALYTLDGRLRILHDFTSDASELLAALKKYKGERALDMDLALSAPQNSFNQALVQIGKESGISENQAFARDHTHPTAEALRMIADHVSSLPGRKNLIWVSGSFPFNLESNNLRRTADGDKIPYATDAEMALRALSSANMAIYPVDARGLFDPGPNGEGVNVVGLVGPSNFGALQNLASRTGGRAYNGNDIMGSVRRTIDNSRVTYELGFYPQGVKWDGSFHALRVKVKRANVQVQARGGYFALPESTIAPQTRGEMLREAALSPIAATGLRFRVEAAGPASPGPRKLALTVSFTARQLTFDEVNGKYTDTTDVAFVQLDDKNQVVDAALLTFPFTLNSAGYEKLMRQGFVFNREFAIRPGAAVMRVLVRDAGNGKIGSVDVPLGSYFPGQPD
jgi:VWFA-related protein